MGSQVVTKEDHSSGLMQKSCIVCRQVLPLTGFHKANGNKDGHRNTCKPCQALYFRAWESKNRKARNEYARLTQASFNRARGRKRRAVKRGLPHVAYDANEIYEREAGLCHLCGVEVDRDTFHVEHLIPIQVDTTLLEAYGILSHPGDVPWNVSIAHPSCNSSKSNRMTQEDVAKYFQYLMLYGG